MSEVKQATKGRTLMYSYHHDDLPPGKGSFAGEQRPAIIVNVFPDEYHTGAGGTEPGYNIQVFTDGMNDGLPLMLWRTSVRIAAAPTPGCLHWPEIV